MNSLRLNSRQWGLNDLKYFELTRKLRKTNDLINTSIETNSNKDDSLQYDWAGSWAVSLTEKNERKWRQSGRL